MDFDGQFSYSPIRTVVIKENAPTVLIYPNPTNNQLTIEGHQNELNQIQMYNMIGQEVTSQVKLFGTTPKMTIDVSTLTSGFYIIKTLNTTTKIYKN